MYYKFEFPYNKGLGLCCEFLTNSNDDLCQGVFPSNDSLNIKSSKLLKFSYFI